MKCVICLKIQEDMSVAITKTNGVSKFLCTQFKRGCSSDVASSYIYCPSKVTEHVASWVSGGQFKIK